MAGKVTPPFDDEGGQFAKGTNDLKGAAGDMLVKGQNCDDNEGKSFGQKGGFSPNTGGDGGPKRGKKS